MFRRQQHGRTARLRSLLLTALLLGEFAFLLSLRADSLELLRDDVRTPAPASDNDDDDDDRRDDDHYDDDCDDGYCDDDCEGTGLFVWAAGMVVAAPFYGPHIAVSDSFARPGYFPNRPYQYDFGYMLIDPIEALGMEGNREPYPWAMRARAEYGTTFSGTDWIGGSVLVETKSRLGFDSELRELREELAPGVRDSLALGDANVHFRFAQSEKLQMRTGLGFNYLTDDRGNDFGFNFTYGGDWYPAAPWVLSSEIDAGWLGHAGLFHFRTTVGVVLGPAEAYTGYDFYDIGRTQFSGLVAGVRLWF